MASYGTQNIAHIDCPHNYWLSLHTPQYSFQQATSCLCNLRDHTQRMLCCNYHYGNMCTKTNALLHNTPMTVTSLIAQNRYAQHFNLTSELDELVQEHEPSRTDSACQDCLWSSSCLHSGISQSLYLLLAGLADLMWETQLQATPCCLHNNLVSRASPFN